MRGHKGLIYSNVESRSYWQFRDPATGEKLTVDVPSALRMNNGDALRKAAIAGHGMVVLPTFIVHRAVKAGELKAVLTECERSPIAMYAVYSSARHRSSRVRAFIDFIVATFNPAPYWNLNAFGPGTGP